uniref:Uncharacterized protein n=1 Tax=Romanomermis culicivorax TaxID=13658 RepID=A0A915IPX5_ROMCU
MISNNSETKRLKGHLYLPFSAEQNRMQSTERNGNFRSVRFGWSLPSVMKTIKDQMLDFCEDNMTQ